MNATERVADYLFKTGWDDFHPDVHHKAKTLSVSALGMAVAGSRIHAGEVLARYARDAGGTPRSGVIGAGFSTTAEMAALVNATAAHSTELEDDSWPESMYTCHIIPAVFALGEELGSSGKEILEAFILGYEIQARPGMVLTNGGANDRGILTAPSLGAIGVAGAAAKLLKLSREETRMALSLAVSQASGSTRQMGTGAHLYEAGVAGRNGISAAKLAKLGLTGEENVFEGRRGYFDMLAGMPDLEFPLGRGSDLRVMEVGFKKYTACYLMQRIVDGVIEIVQQNQLTANDVEKVSIEVNPTFLEIIKFPAPRNGEESRFSMHHCVAAAISGEEISIRTFTDEGVKESHLQAQWSKTELVVRHDWPRAILGESNPLTVRTRDGREYQKLCVVSHGDPEDPLTDEEVRGKYLSCTDGILPLARANEGADMLFALDTMPNVKPLMEILTHP
ncbi:MmgE/PrpD family protein [Hydrogenophaga sp. BPS33]|uniref:MmgE/PrpD family protein n=1 Tax=Hydrogenophaga sp. BPS33 TaxID=2651974 RepID=UPI001320188B|nr:MmgE/PrpD family protein [Hydrogenophaga sp. BPS33]QHE84304.1 MmgE/PrpD family protein [Hydrogenophaga sp. BPS33]